MRIMQSMKTIGLIGGMSWESTAVYYRLLNEMARERLGGLHSARLLLWSFDFAEIERLQQADDWSEAGGLLITAARTLESAGAHCLLICSNTMHRMADQVQEAIDVPLVHIVDATAKAIRRQGALAPLLLGTRYTMEHEFYRGRLCSEHGVDLQVPGPHDRIAVNDIIYQELCLGLIRPASRRRLIELIATARLNGVDSVVLGCTELGLLLRQADLDIPVFDTTRLHVQAALDRALDRQLSG
jgi:aspartate racemase